MNSPKLNLFLLAGQSNMAGRGDVEAVDRMAHERVFVLSRDGAWLPAIDPLHYDKPSAGVGPGKSFAEAVATEDPSSRVGLIPAACGGSPISTWQPGAYFDQTDSHPYDDAIRRAKRAMQDGTLEAILWHQGESDCSPELAPRYKAALIVLIARFRADLGAERLPFIIGQLGHFSEGPLPEAQAIVDAAQREVAEELANVYFVSSADLTCKADGIHFDAASMRVFGQRFAETILEQAGN